MGRLPKPPGVEVDAREQPNAPPGVLLVRLMKETEVGGTASIVSGDARTTAEIADAIRSTGHTFVASIPFEGYVRLVVRRKR